MRLVCISDTHGRFPTLPEGDVLVHAGDFSRRGDLADIVEFGKWLRSVPCKHVVVCYGNHDLFAEQDPRQAKFALLAAANRRRVHVLLDEEAVIEGKRFYAAPWTPEFYDWAFNLKRGAALREKWAKIPEGLDVLVTHGPPFSILDRVTRGDENVGCVDLKQRVLSAKPRFHVFGHIHEGYGIHVTPETTYINAAVLDERYQMVNPPVVVDI